MNPRKTITERIEGRNVCRYKQIVDSRDDQVPCCVDETILAVFSISIGIIESNGCKTITEGIYPIVDGRCHHGSLSINETILVVDFNLRKSPAEEIRVVIDSGNDHVLVPVAKSPLVTLAIGDEHTCDGGRTNRIGKCNHFACSVIFNADTQGFCNEPERKHRPPVRDDGYNRRVC